MTQIVYSFTPKLGGWHEDDSGNTCGVFWECHC
jgi:hypothetical protein